MGKITYDNKIGITPKDVHINQVWDDDMNEIKTVVNDIDDRILSLETGGANPINVSAIWVSGFDFQVTAYNYPILNQYYYAGTALKTLSASDATLDRIDLICAKIPAIEGGTGTIVVIEGTLATTSLVSAPDYDPSQYYVIKEVIIRAASTAPVDSNGNTFTTENVYTDGLGETGEWTFSSNSANIVNSGGFINGTNIVIGDASTMTNNSIVAGLNYFKSFSLSFDITLKADFGSSFIYIKLLNDSGVAITNALLIANGNYGFDASLLTEQTIVVNGSDFSFTSNSNIYAVQIYPYKTFSGYLLDNIKFNIGSNSIISQPYDDTELRNLITIKRVDMGVTNVIDWTPPNGTFLHDNLTTNITLSDTNLPQGTDTKPITLYVNPVTFSISAPIYWVYMGGDFLPNVINTYTIECVNGNAGSELVYYWINAQTI